MKYCLNSKLCFREVEKEIKFKIISTEKKKKYFFVYRKLIENLHLLCFQLPFNSKRD